MTANADRYHGVLVRCYQDETRTLGWMLLFRGLSLIGKFATLELPWLENQRLVSCIPDETYRCVKRFTPKLGQHLHIQGVSNRDWILIHKGNFPEDVKGCICIGYQHSDLDRDGKLDVANSSAAMAFLLDRLKDDELILTVVDPE